MKEGVLPRAMKVVAVLGLWHMAGDDVHPWHSRASFPWNPRAELHIPVFGFLHSVGEGCKLRDLTGGSGAAAGNQEKGGNWDGVFVPFPQ